MARDLSELGQVVAQILRLLFGVLHELLEQLHENRGPHDNFGLVLDAIGVEIVFGTGNPPATPIALGGHDHGMGAGVGVVPALLGALPAIVPAQNPPGPPPIHLRRGPGAQWTPLRAPPARTRDPCRNHNRS